MATLANNKPSMKKIIFFVASIVLVVSCSTFKKVQVLKEALSKKDTIAVQLISEKSKVDSSAIVKSILDNLEQTKIDFKTMNARLKVDYESANNADNYIVNLSLVKDSAIYITIRGAILIDGADRDFLCFVSHCHRWWCGHFEAVDHVECLSSTHLSVELTARVGIITTCHRVARCIAANGDWCTCLDRCRGRERIAAQEIHRTNGARAVFRRRQREMLRAIFSCFGSHCCDDIFRSTRNESDRSTGKYVAVRITQCDRNLRRVLSVCTDVRRPCLECGDARVHSFRKHCHRRECRRCFSIHFRIHTVRACTLRQFSIDVHCRISRRIRLRRNTRLFSVGITEDHIDGR